MFCEKCAADNLETAFSCFNCGHSLLGSSKQLKAVPRSISIWSPDKAAVFSIFFSPVFGAVMQALNWKKLGQKSKAIQSWLWAIAIFFAFNVVAGYGYVHQYSDNDIEKLLQLTQMATIVMWYFLSARKQSKYVITELKDGYTKNSWFNPICISIIIWGGLLWLTS